jgi:hypothetical protein
MSQIMMNIGGPIRITLPPKVAAVKQLVASAAVHGFELTRKPAKLDKQWVKWAKDIRKRR